VDDGGAFETVAERQIAAFRAYAQVLEHGTAQRDHSGADAMVAQIRAAAAVATQHLQRLRELSNVSGSLRAGVLAALDELDRAAMLTSGTDGGPTEKGGAR
jgi:hypothetical protein